MRSSCNIVSTKGHNAGGAEGHRRLIGDAVGLCVQNGTCGDSLSKAVQLYDGALCDVRRCTRALTRSRGG